MLNEQEMEEGNKMSEESYSGEGDEGGKKLMESFGHCFFCLSKISSEAGNSEKSSLQSISHYLGVNKLFKNVSLNVEETKGTLELNIELCGNCTSLNEKFSVAYCQLEIVKMELTWYLMGIQKALLESKESCEELKKNSLNESLDKIKIMEGMRDKILMKCQRKLFKETPQVRLTRLEDLGNGGNGAVLEKSFATDRSSRASPLSQGESNQCQKCKKLFSNQSNLRRHVFSIHGKMPVKKLKCNLCSKFYTSRATLENHKLLFHRKGSKVTNAVGNPLRSLRSNKIGISTSKNESEDCTIINKANIASDVNPAIEEKIADNNEEVFYCKTCDKTFFSKAKRDRHESTFHVHRPRHNCHLCSKSYPYQFSLLRHVRKTHKAKNTRMFVTGQGFYMPKVIEQETNEESTDSYPIISSISPSDDEGSDGSSHENLYKNVKVEVEVDIEDEFPSITASDISTLQEEVSEDDGEAENDELEMGFDGVDDEVNVEEDPLAETETTLTSASSSRSSKRKQALIPLSFGTDDGNTDSPKLQSIFLQSRPVNSNPSILKRFKCSLCEKAYSVPQSLQRHFKEVHLKVLKTCYVCKKQYRKSKDLIKHYRKVHPDSVPEIKTVEPGSKKCKTCLHTLKSNYSVTKKKFITFCSKCTKDRNANESLPTVVQERPVKCLACNKTYTSHAQLTKHFNVIHLNVRKQCEICWKSYRGMRDLRNHRIKRHFGGIDRECQVCRKPFTTSCAHELHDQKLIINHHQKLLQRRTEFEKKFACQICRKMYSSIPCLRRHFETFHTQKQNHTQANLFTCRICRISFKTETSLKFHDRRAHKAEDKLFKDLQEIDGSNYEEKTNDIEIIEKKKVEDKATGSKHLPKEWIDKAKKAQQFRDVELVFKCYKCSKLFDDLKSFEFHKEKSGCTAAVTGQLAVLYHDHDYCG